MRTAINITYSLRPHPTNACQHSSAEAAGRFIVLLLASIVSSVIAAHSRSTTLIPIIDCSQPTRASRLSIPTALAYSSLLRCEGDAGVLVAVRLPLGTEWKRAEFVF